MSVTTARPLSTTTRRSRLTYVLAGTTLAAALALVGCGSGVGNDIGSGSDTSATAATGSLDAMSPVTFKISTMYGPDNFQTQPMIAYTKAVEEASKGKIKFELYYAGSLVPAGQLATGLRDGLIDMAHVAMAYTPAAFPIDTWITKMGYVSDTSPVMGSLQGGAATLDWGINNEAYLKEFTSQGIKPLLPRIQMLHKYNLFCKEKANTLDAVRGKRTRVGGEAWAKEAENVGAVPVTMPGTEVYTSFQQGLLDCFLGTLEDVSALGLDDHGKYFITTNMTSWTSAALLMSQDSWSKLPLEAQQLMWEQLPVYLKSLYETNFALNMKIVGEKSATIEFIEPDASMAKKIADYHSVLPASLEASAPAQMTDAKGAIESYVSTNTKWAGIVKDLGFSDEYTNWPDYVAKKGAGAINVDKWADRVYHDVLEPHKPE